MYTVVYTSHTQPCTCSFTRPCTWPRTRTVCHNGPHTAVTCRLGTCTRRGRPTCCIHGPDDPCTRPSNGRVHGRCTRYVDGRKRQCTPPVYTAENGPARGPYTAVYTRRYGPYTAVYTTRYTAVYDRVDGRFRPCRWPVHDGLVHVDTYTRVRGRIRVVCTARTWPCTRPVYGAV